MTFCRPPMPSVSFTNVVVGYHAQLSFGVAFPLTEWRQLNNSLQFRNEITTLVSGTISLHIKQKTRNGRKFLSDNAYDSRNIDYGSFPHSMPTLSMVLAWWHHTILLVIHLCLYQESQYWEIQKALPHRPPNPNARSFLQCHYFTGLIGISLSVLTNFLPAASLLCYKQPPLRLNSWGLCNLPKNIRFFCICLRIMTFKTFFWIIVIEEKS